jgi:predicted RNA-binding protein YlqC (UPF0109 family)
MAVDEQGGLSDDGNDAVAADAMPAKTAAPAQEAQDAKDVQDTQDAQAMQGDAAGADMAGGKDATDVQIEQLVRDIVIALVDEPDSVQVTSFIDGSSLAIEVRVAACDTGKVIGRQGRIIKSLRTLARAASSYMDGRHIEVEIIDH